MNKRETDPFAQCRAPLAALARKLAKAGPGRRAELVAKILPDARPKALELLAEAMVKLLGDGRHHAGAAASLVALGRGALTALESALLRRQPERRLLPLLPVVVALGRVLPEVDRAELCLAVGIAPAFASTPAGRAALFGVMWDLRDCEREVTTAPAMPGA
jgi:hypothetical protein